MRIVVARILAAVRTQGAADRKPVLWIVARGTVADHKPVLWIVAPDRTAEELEKPRHSRGTPVRSAALTVVARRETPVAAETRAFHHLSVVVAPAPVA